MTSAAWPARQSRAVVTVLNEPYKDTDEQQVVEFDLWEQSQSQHLSFINKEKPAIAASMVESMMLICHKLIAKMQPIVSLLRPSHL